MADRREERDAAPALNENHRRHLLASCQHIDRLLSDIDDIVTAAESASPFARYAADLPPALTRLLRDYIVRLRTDMLRILERHDARPAGRRISAVHAIRTALGFVEVAVEELKPEHIRGYGEVPEALVPEINGFVEELKSVVRSLDQALAAGASGDARQRLARLEQAGADVSVLGTLERIIAGQGLVEFRPALDIALSRLEDQRFEVAVFGRVSSGKSSLLNHLLGQPVLPVGVTPITAVPTRVMHGPRPDVEVHFADRATAHAPLARLGEWVTEQENPANARHVTRLIVRVPSPRLQDGIVFVDTPGLGSLATAGAAQTLAYLPRCDLAVVLIDATSTLTREDVSTLQRLQQAAIPAMVVLSKADLLSPADRDRAVRYAADHLSRELGAAPGVHPVSTVPGYEPLLDGWIEDELRPLLAQHRELARRSIQRKIGALRAGVEASLRARLRRAGPGVDPTSASAVEHELRAASGAFDETQRAVQATGDVREAELDAMLRHIAADVADAVLASPGSPPDGHLVVDQLTHAAVEKAERLTGALAALQTRARDVLAKSAAALRLPEPTSGEDWAEIFRELPQIDPGPITVSLRLPLLGALGPRVARARMRHAIERRTGPQLRAALETHARLLRSWGLRVLDRLRRQFDGQAQVYRAQLAGSTATGSSDESAERALRELTGAATARPATGGPGVAGGP